MPWVCLPGARSFQYHAYLDSPWEVELAPLVQQCAISSTAYPSVLTPMDMVWIWYTVEWVRFDRLYYTIYTYIWFDLCFFVIRYHVMMTCFDDMTWESWNPLMYFHDLNRDVPPKPRQYLENFLLGEIWSEIHHIFNRNSKRYEQTVALGFHHIGPWVRIFCEKVWQDIRRFTSSQK